MSVAMLRAMRDLLHKMPRGAIVAGGAVRDVALGAEVKDFDVLVLDTPLNRMHVEAVFPAVALWDRRLREVKLAYPASLIDVMECHEKHAGRDVQVMFVREKSLAAYVRDVFDYGICKAYYSLEDGLVLTREFMQDMLNKTITHTPSEWNTTSPGHLERLIAKFPDYEVIA